MLAVAVVCGPDDEKAERMAAPARLAVVRNRTGRRAPIASIEEALAYRYTPEEEAIAEEFVVGSIVGGPKRVLSKLAAWRETRAPTNSCCPRSVDLRRPRGVLVRLISRAAGLSEPRAPNGYRAVANIRDGPLSAVPIAAT